MAAANNSMQRTALHAALMLAVGWRPEQVGEASAMKVRELIQLLEKDGWRQVRQRGSHR